MWPERDFQNNWVFPKCDLLIAENVDVLTQPCDLLLKFIEIAAKNKAPTILTMNSNPLDIPDVKGLLQRIDICFNVLEIGLPNHSHREVIALELLRRFPQLQFESMKDIVVEYRTPREIENRLTQLDAERLLAV